jgi:serine/threonine-protein phosphatase PGAM5
VANWDGRADGATKNGVMHTILLVRHGQYEQVRGVDHSDELLIDSQRVLTPLGREQAAATGKRINALVKHGLIPPVENIFYSTMARASETSRCIVEQLSAPPPLFRINACSMLREGAVCVPDPPFAAWHPSAVEFSNDNARVEAAFKAYLHRPAANQTKSSTTLLVCHGNVIRYILLRALQYSPSGWSRMAVYNSSITRIDIFADGRVSVRGVGDVGHLPAEKVTYE